MGLISPQAPRYDIDEVTALPYDQRIRRACQDWVDQGFGAPIGAYGFYALKIALYVGGWYLFARIGQDGPLSSWWAEPMAFAKAVVWSLLFEGLGLGCGSGPLTVRNLPPVAAPAHFLRPGTIRLPPFPDRLAITAGTTRHPLDALGYLAFVVTTVVALLADELTLPLLLAPALLVPALGLRDKTIFLATRGEHYWTTLVVLAVVVTTTPIGTTTPWADVAIFLAGAKAVQLAIWWWAATSKLNRHFPSVVAVMIQNHVLNRSDRLRQATVCGYPDDVRPSRIPTLLAHGGTVIEYAFPLLLVLSDGGIGTTLGLIALISFHTFIFSSFALGVPQEWNVMFVYSAVVLWGGQNALVKPWELGANPLLWAFLLVALVAVPVYGNLRPDKVSFLPSMRYYAGNWGTSTWILTPEAIARIESTVPKASPDVMAQFARLFGDAVIRTTVNRIAVFRAMHLHGRLVQRLICKAVDDPDAYELRDGELLAGVVLGWNFGEGHLHHEQLMGALQERCAFEPGQVRAVIVEAQPIHRAEWHWRIVDAATGLIEEGQASVAEAAGQQPWPDPLVRAAAPATVPAPPPAAVPPPPTGAGAGATGTTPG